MSEAIFNSIIILQGQVKMLADTQVDILATLRHIVKTHKEINNKINNLEESRLEEECPTLKKKNF